MADRREEILARLLTVLEGVEGMAAAYRNRLNIPEDKRPVAILLDSDETADDRAFGKGRPVKSPNLVSMTPEVYVLDAADPIRVGTSLNALRAKVIKAILSDSELVSLAHDGEIRYEGCATGLSIGRSLEGEAALNFTIVYTFRPNEL